MIVILISKTEKNLSFNSIRINKIWKKNSSNSSSITVEDKNFAKVLDKYFWSIWYKHV